jgi:hypothetical protein
MTTADDQAVEPDRLIVEAATGARELTPDELRRVLEHVAGAGFTPAPDTRVGGRLAGIAWQGRTLRGSDRLTSAETHYLRHVVAQQEWPPGTTLDEYLTSIHEVILDPASGALTSRFSGQFWQLALVRRSGALGGPEGYEWLMVEYRVELGHWTTAFQLRDGLPAVTANPERQRQRWLRHPI